MGAAAAKVFVGDRLDFESSLNSLKSVSIHVPHPGLFSSQGGACFEIHKTAKRYIRSITGPTVEDTPMIVPVRGHLDSVKRLMTGVGPSEWGNPYKVAIFGRDECSISCFLQPSIETNQLRAHLLHRLLVILLPFAKNEKETKGRHQTKWFPRKKRVGVEELGRELVTPRERCVTDSLLRHHVAGRSAQDVIHHLRSGKRCRPCTWILPTNVFARSFVAVRTGQGAPVPFLSRGC